MAQLTDDTGIIGFRLSTFGGPRDIFAKMDVREFETYPIWKYAAERDYVLWLYPNAINAHLLPYLIQAFPQVRVVLNHLGCVSRKRQIQLGRIRETSDTGGRVTTSLCTPPTDSRALKMLM